MLASYEGCAAQPAACAWGDNACLLKNNTLTFKKVPVYDA
jgi:hypothetical protein